MITTAENPTGQATYTGTPPAAGGPFTLSPPLLRDSSLCSGLRIRGLCNLPGNSPGRKGSPHRRTIAKLAREVYKDKVGKRDGRCVDMEAAESLFECLEQVPDPRMARGVRHPFQAILRLTLLGLVCGQNIALFARMNWPALKEPLGFLRDHRHHHLPHPGGGPNAAGPDRLGGPHGGGPGTERLGGPSSPRTPTGIPWSW